ncbi:hypothetical protein D3C87_1084430 [compost metagenome]
MIFTPNTMRVTDHPKMLDRLAGGFRVQTMTEAVTMARYGEDITVSNWRSRAKGLVSMVEWTTEDGRKAFADRLTAIVQEAQVLREEAIARGGAA